MDEITKRRVALMERYSAIPMEKIIFRMKMIEQLREIKNKNNK